MQAPFARHVASCYGGGAAGGGCDATACSTAALRRCLAPYEASPFRNDSKWMRQSLEHVLDEARPDAIVLGSSIWGRPFDTHWNAATAEGASVVRVLRSARAKALAESPPRALRAIWRTRTPTRFALDAEWFPTTRVGPFLARDAGVEVFDAHRLTAGLLADGAQGGLSVSAFYDEGHYGPAWCRRR